MNNIQSGKVSLRKILKLFVKTLTVNDKHSLLNGENLKQPIYMILCHKKRTFSSIFFVHLKSILNFQNFHKDRTLIADVFPKLQTSKNGAR